MTALRAGLLAILATVVFPPAAGALTVRFETPVEPNQPALVEVDDEFDEANRVTVTVEGSELVVSDTTATQVTAMYGCSGALAGRTVRCPLPGSVRVNTRGSGDRVAVTGIAAELNGGEGNDILSGGARVDAGPGDDTIAGTDGDDVLAGGPGSDSIAAGAGNDTVRQDPDLAGDVIDGGAGIDSLDFTARQTPVIADLGPATQSAASPGENNTIRGMERVLGGAGADRVRIGVRARLNGPGRKALAAALGNGGTDVLEFYGAAAGTLDGGPGSDTLRGGRGAERLIGSTGNDALLGGGGADVLLAGRGADRVSGGAGADTAYPGEGRDRVHGGSGADRIFARDRERDRINGGSGRDRAMVDTVDRVVGVERLARRR